MVRENSFSDSEGRSLTPDLSEDEDQDFAVRSSSPPPDNDNSQQQTRPNENLVFSFSDGQPTTPGVGLANSEITAAGSGLPPSGSPSVLFKTTSTPNVPTRSNTAGVNLSPRERFRAAVHKVIRMNHASAAMSLGGPIGAEPGVDPRRASAFLNYGHIKQKCQIELIDYSAVRVSFGRMENRGFEEFMMDRRASEREPWVKVRWINIGGLSWDVISSLALRYDIHPLALEDVLHQRGNQARSKADYYYQHVFIRILRHTLSDDEDTKRGETSARSITQLPRSASPDVIREEDEDEEDSNMSVDWGEDITLAESAKRKGTLGRSYSDLEKGRQEGSRGRKRRMNPLRSRRRRAAEKITIEQLKRGDRINVDVTPFFIFLFRDGTVISINQTPEIDFTAPIIARLRQRDTSLRMTADASLLVESLLDLIVDQALEVIDEYQERILKLEREILVKPKVSSVRSLHILSGDLTLHKRTLEPIKTLVYGIRRYDTDRCAALLSSSGETFSSKDGRVQGFFSSKAKIYLADVHDHIDYIISSLDMFSGISENLINYTFNMASYEMNEVMRRLTLATIIFLPLTLLTGYFGMNFQPMWSVDQNSDLLFWEIAIPVMAVVIPAFTIPDIKRLIHFCKKKWTTRKIDKAINRSTRSRVKKTQ